MFVRRDELGALKTLMDSVFGEGAAMAFNVRPVGAVRLNLD